MDIEKDSGQWILKMILYILLLPTLMLSLLWSFPISVYLFLLHMAPLLPPPSPQSNALAIWNRHPKLHYSRHSNINIPGIYTLSASSHTSSVSQDLPNQLHLRSSYGKYFINQDNMPTPYPSNFCFHSLYTQSNCWHIHPPRTVHEKAWSMVTNRWRHRRTYYLGKPVSSVFSCLDVACAVACQSCLPIWTLDGSRSS